MLLEGAWEALEGAGYAPRSKRLTAPLAATTNTYIGQWFVLCVGFGQQQSLRGFAAFTFVDTSEPTQGRPDIGTRCCSPVDLKVTNCTFDVYKNTHLP